MHGYGETVTLLGFTSKWWHVQIREYTGFVPADGSVLDQRTGNYYDGYATAQVHNPISTDRLNLRAEASGEQRVARQILQWMHGRNRSKRERRMEPGSNRQS
ncbi:MAG: hypothetical protein ACLR4A_01525 [Christensenellales bacterium]